MTHELEHVLPRPGLLEMAPRLKQLAEHQPKAVRELEEWLHKAREFGDRFVRPRALEIDRQCQKDPRYFDWELIRRAAPFGFLSMGVPRGAGGGGALSTAMALTMEELCAACAGVANIFGANGLGISGILLGLDFYHYDRALAELAAAERRGDPVLFAAAITEPLAGSDEEDAEYLRSARLMSEARKVAGGYLLNGRKVFISNGSVARYVTVILPLDRRRPVETQSAFLVQQGDQGFQVGRVEEKMGMKACPAAELIFEDCFVPEERLIGREGMAVQFTELVLGASRGPVGAIATGTARGAFERLCDYALHTRSGGRRLIDHQWVQLRLADMARRIHASRQVYLDACLAFDLQSVPRLMSHWSSRLLLDACPAALRRTDLVTRLLRSDRTAERQLALLEQRIRPQDLREVQRYSSMAKVTGSNLAVEIAFEALQVVGLEASLQQLELEKIFRDAKLTQIYEGTNELNLHNLFINTFGRQAPEEVVTHGL